MFCPPRYAKGRDRDDEARHRRGGRRTRKLRKLAVVVGEPRSVVAGDRLDVIAQQSYADATQFWHVADANTALEARDLVAEPGDTLLVPRT